MIHYFSLNIKMFTIFNYFLNSLRLWKDHKNCKNCKNHIFAHNSLNNALIFNL